MIIRGNKVNTYTKTYNNQIGPTTESRTVTSHNDSNCKYVAPNGNDTTGTGTAANPYLTLDKAISTLAGAFTIVTVERNGYVGDMVFDNITEEIPANTVIQVEDEEKATIKTAGYTSVTASSGIGAGQSWSMIEYIYTHDVWLIGGFVVPRLYYSRDGGTTFTAASGLGALITSLDGAATNGVIYAGDIIVVAHGTTTNNMFQSTDGGANWSVIVHGTGYGFTDITYGNGIWVACADGGPICYSIDKTTWSECNSVSADWKDVLYANGMFVAIAEDAETPAAYSIDGINWTAAKGISNYSCRDLSHDGEKFILSSYTAIGGDIIYISTNGINWTQLVEFSDRVFYKIRYAYGRYWGTESTGLYVSDDMLTWTQVVAFVDYVVFDFGQGICLYAGADGPPGLEIQKLWGLTNIIFNNYDITINGFTIDGDNKANGIISGERIISVGHGYVKWCKFQNITGYPMEKCFGFTVSQTEFADGEYGSYWGTPSYFFDCIFYNISEYAIHDPHNIIDVEHCTFYNCNKALYYPYLSIATLTNLKNNIFYRCVYDIYLTAIPSTTVELTYSVSTGLLYNATADEDTCLIGAKALFEDEDNDDFQIRHIEDGYPIESPGVDLADDSRDAGAWDVSFSLDDTEFDTITLESQKISVRRQYVQVKPDSGFTFGGGFHRSIITQPLEQWTVEANQIARTNMLYQFARLSGMDDVVQVFPNGHTYRTVSGGSFIWENKSDVNGLVRFTPPSSAIQGIEDFIGEYESANGLSIVVSSISGSIAPFNAYPFKIIESDLDQHSFLLENTHDRFPGTGFDANPDGTRTCQIWRTLGIVILQYIGVGEDGLLEFDATNLGQKFEIDQWRDYYFHHQYNYPIGFPRKYFRIDHNTEDVIYAEDVFGNVGVLTPSSYYRCSIDLTMMKVNPDNVQPSQPPNSVEFSRNGNDIWSTEVTREENTTISKTAWVDNNEKGQSITLTMSRTESDGDGL
jgi:hypothetical protein